MTQSPAGTVSIAAQPELVWTVVRDPLCWPWLGDHPTSVCFVRRHGDRTLYQVDGVGFAVSTDDAGLRGALCLVPDGTGPDLSQSGGWPESAELTWSVRADADQTRLEWSARSAPVPEPVAALWRRAATFPGVIERWAKQVGGEGIHGVDPVRAATELAPMLSERAAASERARTLLPDVVAAMRAGGLFSMGLPRALGGLESDGPTIVAVVEALARADGAAGWCAQIGNQTAFLAWLDQGVAADLVGGADTLVIAGSTGVFGHAQVVDEVTYRISGHWRFNSGCVHADWLMAGFTEPPSPDGVPRARLAFLPTSAATILGTWNVAGLSGTGSHDVELDGVEVPVARTAPLYYTGARFGGPLHRLSPYNVQAVLMVGVPLGLARRAIDEVVALGDGGYGDTAVTDVARAEIELAAARALALATVRDYWTTLGSTPALPPAEEAKLALVLRHVTETAKRITERMLRLAGPAAEPDSALGRCLRDVYAAGQHIAVSDDVYERNARRYLSEPVPALY